MPAKANTRIAQLGEALHPGITTDPHWPALAQQLHIAEGAGLSDAQMHRIATARPLPIDEPASALAYRLVDRTPTTRTTAVTATATARSIAGKAVPPEHTVRRPYEPPPVPLPTPPPDYARVFGSQPRPGPRR